MVDFAGWLLPIQYETGINSEHLAVRKGGGLFDVSHMASIVISGPQSAKFLDYITCNSVKPLLQGKAQYSAMLNPAGGVIDDLILTRFAEDDFVMVDNAANAAGDLEWITKHAEDFEVSVRNVRDSCGLLALQGPLAKEIVQGVFPEAAALSYMSAKKGQFNGREITIWRSGYTGEDGFEFQVAKEDASELWRLLLKIGAGRVIPCGLGARDTLRLEAAFPLHGHEITPYISPIEGGISWIVKLDKGDFIGRDAVQRHKASPPRSLVGLKLDVGPIARAGATVSFNDDQVGVVTSGTKTASFPFPIAMALVSAGVVKVGDRVDVMIRDKVSKAEVVKLPFYKRSL